MVNKEHSEFEFEDKKYIVRKPTNKIRRESESIYAKTYRESLKNGFFLQAEIDATLEDKGFTDKIERRKRDELVRNVRKLEAKLVNEDYENEEAGRALAFEVQDLRDELMNTDRARQELEAQSAERQAENRRFSYFAYRCCTTEAGEAIWGDFEEFENDESPMAFRVANELLLLIYNVTQDSQKETSFNRAENRWLMKHSYMNKNLDLVREDGKIIDREGHLLNDSGQFINDEGHRIDIFGNLLTEEGELLFPEDKVEKEDKALSVKKRKTKTKKVISSDEKLEPEPELEPEPVESA